jgi:type I restriction enzyme M protein
VEILSPADTIREFKEKRNLLNSKIDKRLEKISALLGV